MTEAVRRKPYAVILFDEIEKAHPDVFNVLLQILDDGRITEAQGRTGDFKNTVIIMTSNIGSRFLLEGVHGNEIPDGVRESVMSEQRRSFRPEFLNRIDETILFKPLSLEEITVIVDLLLADLNKRLAERQVTLKLDVRAKEWVAEKEYDPGLSVARASRLTTAFQKSRTGQFRCGPRPFIKPALSRRGSE